MPCHAALYCAVLGCAVMWSVVLCRVVLCYALSCCVVLCCVVLCCGVLCCVVMCVVPCCYCWRGKEGGKENHPAPCPPSWGGGDPYPESFTHLLSLMYSKDRVSGLGRMPPSGQGLGAAAWRTPLLVWVSFVVSSGQA